MDIELLRTFLHVAKLGSFTKAAEQLNASQSTISGHIAKLEDKLQVQLFKRTTRHCQITANGNDLLRHATDVIEAMNRLENAFRPSILGGIIRLGIPDDYYLFPTVSAAVKSFIERRPKASIKIESGLSSDHLRALRNGHLDLALVRQRITDPADENLCPIDLTWVGAPSIDLDAMEVLPLAHINGPCLYFAAMREALDAQVQPWRAVCSCSTLEGVRSAVMSGMAIAALPDLDLPANCSRLQHGRLPPLPKFCMGVKFSEDEPTLLVQLLATALTTALVSAAA